MSSGAGGAAELAPVLFIVPPAVGAAVVGAAVLGAGWLAWQSGKLLVAGGQQLLEANRSINAEIARKKAERKTGDVLRRQRATAGFEKILQVCGSLRDDLAIRATAGVPGQEELTMLRAQTEDILRTPMPEDAERIESVNAMLLARLKEIKTRFKAVDTADAHHKESEAKLQQILAALESSFAVMPVESGIDIQAPDPDIAERALLNERLNTAAVNALSAWDFVMEYSQAVGISTGNMNWIESCLGDAQACIHELCDPTISNAAFKDGLCRLEEDVDRFERFVPILSRERAELTALYSAYAEAAKVMGEKVRPLLSFHASKRELEDEMRRLGEHFKRAQECNRIYHALGKSGYLCYAWDQVLQELGYTVHSRQHIHDLSARDLEYAQTDAGVFPFYTWGTDKLTQFYRITEDCDLQLLVHNDGTITMQTIAGKNDEIVKSVQKSHCERLKAVRERLQADWFINYDGEEVLPPDTVLTAEEWCRYINSDDMSHVPDAGIRVSQTEQQHLAQHQP